MDFVICPSCSTRVLTASNGQCPACRHSITPGQVLAAQLVSDATNATAIQVTREEVLNPYQAPLLSDHATIERDLGKRGWIWLLFLTSGRISRGTFWGTWIGCFVIMLTITTVSVPLIDRMGTVAVIPASRLAYIWISFALVVKRWHDLNKSGYWVFIWLIPVFGPIWTFVEVGCSRGTVGPNRYGPDPLGGKERYKSPQDLVNAAVRLEMQGDGDKAVANYRRVSDEWPEYSEYARVCIQGIEEKQRMAE